MTRDDIAMLLATTGGLTGYRPFPSEPGMMPIDVPIEQGRYQRRPVWKQDVETLRNREDLRLLPQEMPYEELYRPRKVPSDQPTGERTRSYYLKRQL